MIGFAFKVAAVPLHAWAPPTYDGAPLPVAAYLSTASKLGGVVALLRRAVRRPLPATSGPVLAVLAVLTMTVGNLVALRQTPDGAAAGLVVGGPGRLHPGAARRRAGRRTTPRRAVAPRSAYAVFFVVLEFVRVRVPWWRCARRAADGGDDRRRTAARPGGRRGWARRSCWRWPGWPGCRPGWPACSPRSRWCDALLDRRWAWLAVVVALNAVIGLAYYVRVAACYALGSAPVPTGPPAAGPAVPPAVPWPPGGLAVPSP